ncbi:hypothetical protein [Lacisediminihabitans profunda]|uniref:Lipocalin-like domain-containing protein n=1 Tax=Lacisediminihabitans profunda TaxID=2594790 RepID=A0A5C8UXJ1_9MICO|nr:hypothetical protein [Lacisediminihabitans profunda]TXN32823.1 hypothetical protein FVP33_00185 [Lacisediminihabitans profunda]
MPSAPDEASLTRLLPGTWRIGATNFPFWLNGDRLSPTFTYELAKTGPLSLRDTVEWTTPDGRERRLVGVDRWRGDDFRRRGKGVLALTSSRWSVTGVSEDSTIVVIRYSKTLFSPAGVDVVTREGADAHTLRTRVAESPEGLGLTHEEFASLTWLELKPE